MIVTDEILLAEAYWYNRTWHPGVDLFDSKQVNDFFREQIMREAILVNLGYDTGYKAGKNAKG